jgi:hypothetical protein
MTIGHGTFSYCRGLTSVTIPDSVESIGNHDFSYFASLTSVTIPATVQTVANYGFAGCSNLSSVTFQTELITETNGDYQYSYTRGVSQIGEYTFSGCTKLAFLVIPESVQTIHQNAFANCSGLENLTLGKATSSSFVGLSFSGCDNLTAINVDDENPDFASENGVFYNKEKTVLYKYPTGKSGEYIVPGSVMAITDYAFDDCAKLTSVVIPNTVTSISGYAFDGCTKLESITMPLKPIKNFTYGFGQMFHYTDK